MQLIDHGFRTRTDSEGRSMLYREFKGQELRVRLRLKDEVDRSEFTCTIYVRARGLEVALVNTNSISIVMACVRNFEAGEREDMTPYEVVVVKRGFVFV